MKVKIYILTTLALLFSSSLLKAQFPTQQGGSGSGFPTSGFPTGNNPNGTFPQNDPQNKNTNTSGRIGLDDSTKVIYGPTSTRYFLEEDVVNNRKRLYTIDTTLDGIHNFNFVQRNKNLYQDLGNIGSAIRPVFYKAPEQIGTLLGYDAYTLYDIKPSQVRYYNTKSPFSNIIYIPGGGDQDLLQFELSRNVDSLWNVGINVQRISANKTLVDRSATSDNTAISHWDFTIHSNYQTRNKKYSLLAFVNLADRNVNDQGGSVLETGRDYTEMLALDGNRPILTTAFSRDKSYNFHLYHEYVGYKAFQVYQTIDVQTRKVQYIDKNFAANWENGFYPLAYQKVDLMAKGVKFPTDTATFRKLALDSVYNENIYTNYEIKTGLKGFYKGFNYRAHFRQRFFSNSNYSLDTSIPNGEYSESKGESFLGLWLNQYFKDSTRAFGEVETSLDFSSFRVNGEFQGKWLNVGGSYISTTPTLVQQKMLNNAFRWRNSVAANVASLNAYAYTNLKLGTLNLRPNIEINRISDLIYFDKDAFVQQNNSQIFITRIGLGIDYRWRKLSTTNQLFVNLQEESVDKIMPAPTYFINSRIAVDLLFKKKLFIQTGIDINYQSGYQGYAYMPVTQQFHLQGNSQGQEPYNIQGYAQVDIFADMRINRVRLFFKFAHANHRLPLMGNGYYAAPGFAGMGRVLAFGVHWLLFD
ncbi:MAG: putative porin [Arcicella sp.]|nr:putative porin [Arcicella sp.]